MLQLTGIAYSIGDRELFSDVNLTIGTSDRYGLVGANGTGKTTLLRIIKGDLLPSKGSVDKLKAVTIGYLPQEEIVLHGSTLLEEVLRDYNVHMTRLEHLRQLISEHPETGGLLKQYEHAEERFHAFGGYEYEVEAHKVIRGLGFDVTDYKKPVQAFSSGWQMRIVLARLLLNKPDLLLLDEPTNHLDIESIQWLEEYLQDFRGAIIVVSHDRYFLDRILKTQQGTSGICEIDFSVFRKYRMNYTSYLRESQTRKQRLLQLAKEQEKKIRAIKEFIVRNKANKKKAKLVRSREKYLERMERIQVEQERKKIKVRFPVEPVHSKRLVVLSDVSKSYDGHLVLTDIHLTVQKGDRIALIGKNGAGKSTLCRIIAGYEQPTRGTKKISERLHIAAFSHEILLQLDPKNTVLEETQKDASAEVCERARTFLGLFLFTGDDVFKKVDVLSGGEKTRLVICKAMLEPSNLLILDEPTYHLDRDSVGAIRQALTSYNGTTILVTHDRDLVASFATRIIELKHGRLFDYPGDYEYYLWKKRGSVEKKKGVAKKEETLHQKLQKQIVQKQARREKLRDSFSRSTVINNPRKSKKLFEEYQRLTEEMEELEKKLIEYEK